MNNSLLAKPFLDDQLHGLFATRYPYRPNRIGLSVVQLVMRKGPDLEIQGSTCWMVPRFWISSLT